jgi:hypothetical protein
VRVVFIVSLSICSLIDCSIALRAARFIINPLLLLISATLCFCKPRAAEPVVP